MMPPWFWPALSVWLLAVGVWAIWLATTTTHKPTSTTTTDRRNTQ